ncbi:MAG: response regulator transcription factor [Candidatus Eremiobacteraeota bacterium]|nr:response regulator transcription factor [Candidatus Eremiobacteraeota bacterium]
MRVVLADDEAPARRKLARFLRESDGVELAGEARTGSEALGLIASERPDLVFLDVQMPDLDGVAVAQVLAAQERAPRVVFVTAFDRHAVRAFELGALDYLLKPFDRERFDRALERARDALAARPAETSAQIAELIARLRGDDRYVRRLLISDGDRSFYVPVREIVRLEADGNDVVVHTRRGAHAIRATLESLEARLDPAQFARVHRSHLVNIDAIAEIRAWFHGDHKLVLRDGSEITWSRRYAAKRPDLLR